MVGINLEESRLKARKRLKEATRTEYEHLIYAAKLTPRQEKIVNFYIVHDFSVCKIALKLSCCEATVRKELARAYDKVALL